MGDEKQQPMKDEASKRREWRGDEEPGAEAGNSADNGDGAKPSSVTPGQFAPPD